MTVIDRIRAATADDQGESHPELVAAGWGALTAAISWLGVTALVVLGVLLSSDGTASFGQALGAGSGVWLALGGARLHLGAATIALTPLLGLLVVVLVARLGARRALRDLPEGTGDVDETSNRLPQWARRLAVDPFARTAGAWVGGYAAVALLGWAMTPFGPLGIAPLSAVLPVLAVPALGVLLSGARELDVVGDRMPSALRRGLEPGLRGVVRAIGIGSVLVLLMVAIHISRVWHVQSELGAGLAGGALITAVQLLALPNLGIWGLSWLAGPGFSLSLGAQTTWAEAQTSLLPMIPVFAAHPEPGHLPWITRLAVLVPVAVGAWIARDALSRVSRLSRTSVKASAVAAAVAVTATGVGVLDALGGGSLGSDRLADLGVPTLQLVLALLVTLGIGGALVVAHDWWRQRR